MKIVVNEKFRLIAENEINKKLETFRRLGMESKALLSSSKKEDVRDTVSAMYHTMGKILIELEAYLPMIKEQNPRMSPLIDMLLLFSKDGHGY